MAALVQPDLTRAAYRHTLEALYGFQAPVERCLLREVPSAFPTFSMAERSRVRYLEQDLIALGSDPRRIPLATLTQTPASAPELLGWLYVVEGSTLGGRLLCRRIGETLRLQPDHGLAFFHGYGDATAARWREVLTLLAAFDEAQVEATGSVVGAARCAFSTLHTWLDQYVPIDHTAPQPA